MKTGVQRDISIPMFTEALFTIGKLWKECKWPSMNKWIEKCKPHTHTHTQTHTHRGILFSHKKEGNPAICDNMDKLWGHYAKWDKSDKRSTIWYHLYVEAKKAELVEKESRMMATDGWVEGV